MSVGRGCVAGGVAAALWGVQEPLDRHLMGTSFSDVSFLGKLLTRDPVLSLLLPGAKNEAKRAQLASNSWRVGMLCHMLNGAAVGGLISLVSRRSGWGPMKASMAVIMTEHVATYPLTYWSDRYHPARKEGDVGPVFDRPREFAVATWRHILFGLVVGLGLKAM
eukprot:TRINITY_DN16567_c0_g1_i1.p1 TRINITY_DN16567_c0_g1~~TRINITY_DN16567_c0_g1_i1.p1  ORF type:complete len:164 (-),score=15.00 TRINITY_DN16567_c0_g1_i1:7-498(-)